MDDQFARVAAWWDRAMPGERAACLALAYRDVGLAQCRWAELEGAVRWSLVGGMRRLVLELAPALQGVVN